MESLISLSCAFPKSSCPSSADSGCDVGNNLWRGLQNLIFIFILTGWGGYRQVRAKMLSLAKKNMFRQCGLSEYDYVIDKYMLPNAIGPVIVNLTLSTRDVHSGRGGDEFLGIGTARTGNQGNILNAAQELLACYCKTIGGCGCLSARWFHCSLSAST